MDQENEDGNCDSDFDDPVLGAHLIAELERVVGRVDGAGSVPRFRWFLPLGGIGEMLDLLREIPSDIGVDGFEARLRERFGSLSSLRRVESEPRNAVV